MNYDIVSFARSVMVSDVHKLFVSASFPPELRLQVMKAGVPRNTVCKLSSYRQRLYLGVAWCQRTITCMDVLKTRFPNLKACVLTLDLSLFEPALHPFDQLALEWTTGTGVNFGSFETSLPAEASSLFNAFIAKGPGKSQFVRIRHFPGSSHDKHTDGSVHYGPLVKGEKMAANPEKGSFGTQLFRDAYRLARSGQSTVEARMLKK